LGERRRAVQLRCQHCEYQWNYAGGRRYATCPNCLYKVKTPYSSPHKSEILTEEILRVVNEHGLEGFNLALLKQHLEGASDSLKQFLLAVLEQLQAKAKENREDGK
jgi:hypothetical protein